jgi:hypothetical protein
MLLERLSEGATEQDQLRRLLTSGASVANSSAPVPAAAPSGAVGVVGWSSESDRNAAIATINGLRTLAAELQLQLNALLAVLRAQNVISS